MIQLPQNNPSNLLTRVHSFSYDWKDSALYALGIGAKRDSELHYLYEGLGPKVIPSFATVASTPAMEELLQIIQGDLRGLIHAGQKIVLRQPFLPSGQLQVQGKVVGMYDLKRMAQVVCLVEIRDASKNLLAETEWNLLFRFDGDFGGPRPPKQNRVIIPERAPDFEIKDTTTQEQALLYRLMGDINPLHADPEVAQAVGFEHPILHGLCTYGFVCRAVISACCDGKPERLRSLQGRFTKPVFPGDTLITRGWVQDEQVTLQASTVERPNEVAFSAGKAELHEIS